MIEHNENNNGQGPEVETIQQMTRGRSYQRKTRDEWQLWSNYGYGWEHEISEDSWREMRAQLKCYRENCPNGSFRAKKIRVRIEAENKR